MASTYTTRIRLNKQGTGDNDSTWGTVLNDEVIDLTDFAIAGYTTISLVGGDVSLTANDGAADTARSAMLELTGTLTGDTGVYLPSGITKSYIVKNNTSGSYAATVLIDGGTASAAEIFAAAVRRYRDAPLVGTRSFGKGLFQQLIELEGGGALDLSVGEFLTAEGESLAGRGLTPDIEVGEGRGKDDRQLDRAIAILRDGSSRVGS